MNWTPPTSVHWLSASWCGVRPRGLTVGNFVRQEKANAFSMRSVSAVERLLQWDTLAESYPAWRRRPVQVTRRWGSLRVYCALACRTSASSSLFWQSCCGRRHGVCRADLRLDPSHLIWDTAAIGFIDHINVPVQVSRRPCSPAAPPACMVGASAGLGSHSDTGSAYETMIVRTSAIWGN